MPKDAEMRRLLGATTKLDRSHRTDRDLLRQFVEGRDQDAFEALVKRHSNLVLGICCRSLPNHQDAEDACQAVFMILAKKAHSERWQASIANWLYSTARKVSRNARTVAKRRGKHEGQTAVPKSLSPLDQMTGRELLAALDGELERLPAIYREPLVLCHLEGLSRSDAAARLEIGVSTIKIRLERGRRKLADALAKRGIEVGAGLLAVAATSSAGASSPRIGESIMATVGGSPSASVAAIAKGIAVNGFSLKVKMVALASVLAVLTGLGLSMQIAASPQKTAIARTQQPAPKGEAKSNAEPKAEQPVVKSDDMPKFKPIDSETIAAYEKIGAVFGGFDVSVFEGAKFFMGKTAAETRLPGFCFVEVQDNMLPKLPPVQVPFGLLFKSVTDADLKKVKELKNLTLLAAPCTKVTDAGLEELSKLKNLSTLDLRSTSITDAGLKVLKDLNNLTTLCLSDTMVTGGGLKEIKNLKHLITLSLASTKVTDAGFNELKDLKNLAALDLGKTQMTDLGLKELTNLKKLATLSLYSTQVTDVGLKDLKDLKNLTALHLGDTNITDVGLKQVKELKNLTELFLDYTRVTDMSLKELKDLKHLTSLNLYMSREVTDMGLNELKDLKNLTEIYLSYTNITDAGLKVVKEFKNLTRLSFARTKVTDVGLRELKDLKNLTWLDFMHTTVTNAGLKELKGLKNLTTLFLCDTQVTDAGLKELKNLKNLTNLFLSETQVTDGGVKELKESLPRCHIFR